MKSLLLSIGTRGDMEPFLAVSKVLQEKGIRIDKITTKNLEPKICELVNNPSFKDTAEHIAGQM